MSISKREDSVSYFSRVSRGKKKRMGHFLTKKFVYGFNVQREFRRKIFAHCREVGIKFVGNIRRAMKQARLRREFFNGYGRFLSFEATYII